MVFEFNTAGIGRIAANAGADFVVLDQEHTGWNIETIRSLIAATRAADTVPLVRVPATQYHLISRPFDVDAMGIMAPMSESEGQGRLLVRSAKYPPVGQLIRGPADSISSLPGHCPRGQRKVRGNCISRTYRGRVVREGGGARGGRDSTFTAAASEVNCPTRPGPGSVATNRRLHRPLSDRLAQDQSGQPADQAADEGADGGAADRRRKDAPGEGRPHAQDAQRRDGAEHHPDQSPSRCADHRPDSFPSDQSNFRPGAVVLLPRRIRSHVVSL